MKIVYRGFARQRQYGENDHAFFIGDSDEPLAKLVEEAIDDHGHYLSVRWFVSDTEKTVDELEADLIQHAFGVGEAAYSDAYSEITGYLWTDESLMVGGHDVLDRLDDDAFTGAEEVGRFVHLEIEYSKEPRQ